MPWLLLYGPNVSFCVILNKLMEKLNGLSLIRLRRAIRFLCEIKKSGGNIVFVSTHFLTRSIIKQIARSCDSYYVIEDWIKGFLTKKILLSNSINSRFKAAYQNNEGELYKGVDLSLVNKDNIFVNDLYDEYLKESNLKQNLANVSNASSNASYSTEYDNSNLDGNFSFGFKGNTIGAIVLLDNDNILKRVILKEAFKVSIPVVSIVNPVSSPQAVPPTFTCPSFP